MIKFDYTDEISKVSRRNLIEPITACNHVKKLLSKRYSISIS